MDPIVRVSVVHCDADPQRVDTKKIPEEWIVNCVDARSISQVLSQEEVEFIGSNRVTSERAIFLSHVQCWAKFLEDNTATYLMVFEDDAIWHNNIKKISEQLLSELAENGVIDDDNEFLLYLWNGFWALFHNPILFPGVGEWTRNVNIHPDMAWDRLQKVSNGTRFEDILKESPPPNVSANTIFDLECYLYEKQYGRAYDIEPVYETTIDNKAIKIAYDDANYLAGGVSYILNKNLARRLLSEYKKYWLEYPVDNYMSLMSRGEINGEEKSMALTILPTEYEGECPQNPLVRIPCGQGLNTGSTKLSQQKSRKPAQVNRNDHDSQLKRIKEIFNTTRAYEDNAMSQ